jgi:DNA-binding MarR family transcriptional regulator
LPEIELRKSIRVTEPAENLGLPGPRTSLEEVRRILERAANRENCRELYGILAARAGIDLDPRACWTLYRLADWPGSTLEEMSDRLGISADRLGFGVESLVAAGMVESMTGAKGQGLVLTAAGRSAIEKLTVARRDSMTELLEGWNPEEHPEVIELIRHLAESLLADDTKLLADARSSAG